MIEYKYHRFFHVKLATSTSSNSSARYFRSVALSSAFCVSVYISYCTWLLLLRVSCIESSAFRSFISRSYLLYARLIQRVDINKSCPPFNKHRGIIGNIHHGLIRHSHHSSGEFKGGDGFLYTMRLSPYIGYHICLAVSS